ncbi:MAG: OmpA family protein [Candidatus Delongbacteria bacterium]|jgi:outer membrane protein OmpA-like peptidoglycan-associated protein|nr:OmpA family protein [Candidatus Delongbacteria bacterium]
MKVTSFIIVFITGFVFQTMVSAQVPRSDSCGISENKKAEKHFDKAIELYYEDRDQSKNYLLKAIEEDQNFADAYYVLADIAYQQYQNSTLPKQKKTLRAKAQNYMIKVVNICPGYDEYRVNYLIGENFYLNKEDEKALEYLEFYLEHGNKEYPEYSAAKSIIDELKTIRKLKQKPVPFNPEPVKGVSTPDDEYLPLISPDGELMFFTIRYLKNDINSIYGDRMIEEFTVAHKADTTYMHYSNSKAMPPPFNKGNNQGGISITIDNSCLFVTQCEFVSADYRNCDIYMSKRTKGGWTELISLSPNINNHWTWESQPSISPDGNTLFFASIRPENMGNNGDKQTSDIYYSERQEDNTWSEAKNIGSSINTAGNEKSPFFHADNKTLYFSSDRHAGLGGYDIFYSQYIDGAWQKPVNIGYPINTKKDDLGFVVNTQGNRAYFASNQLADKGKGGYDIFSFKLYEDARPDEVLFVRGQILDEKGTPLTDAHVEIKNTNTSEVSEGIVNDETGDYAVAVRMDEEQEDDYIMLVKKENYSFTSKYIDPEEIETDKNLNVDMEVKPIEKGQAVKINDIYFGFGSDEFDVKSLIVLDNFIEFLNDNPSIEFEIHGHTDNIGKASANMALSRKRARAVYDYLHHNGIDKSRMDYKGFGENQPVASNKTEEGRAKNRRTEFYIVNY